MNPAPCARQHNRVLVHERRRNRRGRRDMGQPVVHFEVIGKDPQRLRGYYGDLFGWEFDTSSPVAPEVSEPDGYGFTDGNTTSDGLGIPGGVGGGTAYPPHV